MSIKKIYPLSIILFAVFFFMFICFKVPGINEETGNGNHNSAGGTPELSSLPRDRKSAFSPNSPTTPPGEPEQELSVEDIAENFPFALTDRESVAAWVQNNFTGYFQKYNLSCEAAIIRLVTGIWGIHDLSEDDILDMMPSHPSNPELGLVMENIRGNVYFPDGSINWANYGAHPPVVQKTLEIILRNKGMDTLYRIDKKKLDNKELIAFLNTDTECLGAIIWVAAYINNEKPPVNEVGQVLGEHVQYVSPLLSKQGKMLVYDVWPWENQPFHLLVPFNREMFEYETLLIMKKK